MSNTDGNVYECRPGGSCPVCNAEDERCEQCEELLEECSCPVYCKECGKEIEQEEACIISDDIVCEKCYEEIKAFVARTHLIDCKFRGKLGA